MNFFPLDFVEQLSVPHKLRFVMPNTFSLRTYKFGLLVAVLAASVGSAMAQADVQGQWSTASYQMPINPVHAALLKKTGKYWLWRVRETACRRCRVVRRARPMAQQTDQEPSWSIPPRESLRNLRCHGTCSAMAWWCCRMDARSSTGGRYNRNQPSLDRPSPHLAIRN